MPDSLVIADYRPEMRDLLVTLWRESFLQGVGSPVPNPKEEHRRFVDEHLRHQTTMRVALVDDTLAGFVSFTPESVEQLYVGVPHHGRGIGSRLLELAQRQARAGLRLYTFASNTRAQRFYEGHGFEIVERGIEPVTQWPDILYRWRPAAAPRTGAVTR